MKCVSLVEAWTTFWCRHAIVMLWTLLELNSRPLIQPEQSGLSGNVCWNPLLFQLIFLREVRRDHLE